MLSSKFSKLLILQAMCKCPYKLSVNVKLVCQRTGKAWVVQHVLINPKRAPFFCITCIEIEARYFSSLSGFKFSFFSGDSGQRGRAFVIQHARVVERVIDLQSAGNFPGAQMLPPNMLGVGHSYSSQTARGPLRPGSRSRVRSFAFSNAPRTLELFKANDSTVYAVLGSKEMRSKIDIYFAGSRTPDGAASIRMHGWRHAKNAAAEEMFFFFTVIKKPSVRGGLSGGRNGMQSRQFSVRVPVKSDVTVRYRYARLYCFGQVLF